jgi:hypothetical protein
MNAFMVAGGWWLAVGDWHPKFNQPPTPTTNHYSDSHHLKVDFPVVRAVELGKENVLPGPEFQPAVNDRNGNAMADHDGAKVRVGVPAITIGKQWVIVFVIDGARDDLLEQVGHVREQRALDFIHHQPGRGVQRRDVNNAVADRGLLDESGDLSGNAFQFDSLFCPDDERGGGYFVMSFFGLYLWICLYRRKR